MSAPANRLVHETSPYLLQHAHNPVDWYPWGDEALSAARAQDKPIFLSIGYSACHWCHVMERESFEDPATAAILNEHFISIKVDREERPDLDQIYMNAVQLLTQHGGWPMSVWLTPERKPFYAGTYFPPEPRYQMPSFRQVLTQLAQIYRTRRPEVMQSADSIVANLEQLGAIEQTDGALGLELIENAARQLERMIDPQFGGIGRAPKFPHSVEMRLLMLASELTGRSHYRDLALLTLDRMIHGGIYDQLGGGFHRYSTDQRWLAPHFEKMLYDNALIPLACLEAWQLTGAEHYRRATTETLDYLSREMTSPDGGFFSTQDADSEGEEGKFFVWTRPELDRLLGPERGERFASCYDVSEIGNWEGKNILHLPKPLDVCAKQLGVRIDALQAELAESRRVLFEARSRRIAPGRDEKILTAWNGMAIHAFATAANVLSEPRYRDAAVRAARFCLGRLRAGNGLLCRTYKDGRARLNGYLEDYAYLANGLVSVYEATFEPEWLEAAAQMADRMIEQFWDEHEAGFFFTGKDHEELIVRAKDPQDGATPSGNSMAVTALARLARLTGRSEYTAKTEQTLRLFRGQMARSAIASAQMLLASAFHIGPAVEIAVVGRRKDPETEQVLETVFRRYLPSKVVAFAEPESAKQLGQRVPLLTDKEVSSTRPVVYICRDFACQKPIIGLADLESAFPKFGVATASIEQ